MAQAFFYTPRSIWVSFPGRKVGHKMRTDLIEYQPSLKSLPPSAKARSGSIMESHMLREEEEEKEAGEEEEEEEEEDDDEEGEVPAAVSEEKAGITGHGSRSRRSSAWSLSSLEQALYLSLPGCVQAALLCNLMARMGLVGFQDSFPARLISYLLLPYTLPACIFFRFAHRLLLRLRHIPRQAFWLWQDVKQIWLFFCRTTASSVRKNLADRNVLGHLRVLSARFLPSIHLSPALEFLSEDEVPTETARVRRRSTLRLQLCGLSSSESRAQPCPDALAFSLQLDLGLEMDSQPDALALPPCQPPPPLEFHPSSEGEDEIASSLSAAQMPAGGGGEGEGGARERRTQQPAAVHG